MRTLTRNTPVRLLALLAALALVGAACSPDDPLAEEPQAEREDVAVTIGSANFPESVLLAHIYAGALEHAGVTVVRQLNIGTREVYFAALRQGEIDLLPEYVGSLHNHVTGGDEDLTETADLVDDLREQLGPEIVLLEPAEAQNGNAMLVTPETAEEYGLETLSDLGEVSDQLVGGGPPEVRERPDGLPGLREVYGIDFAEWRDLDAGGPLTIEALRRGDIDVARAWSTLGVIGQEGWIELEDDRHLFNAENITPVIRSEVLTPTIEEVLNEISQRLTTEDLIAMNVRTEVDNDDPDVVAEDWLRDQGLID